MSQCLKLNITEADIRDAERFKIRNPILYVLQRQTGTLWCVDEERSLRETIAPYRNCRLTMEVWRSWQEYSACGRMQPCEIEVELHGEQSCPALLHPTSEMPHVEALSGHHKAER